MCFHLLQLYLLLTLENLPTAARVSVNHAILVAAAATTDESQAWSSAWLEEKSSFPQKKKAKPTFFGGERYDTSVNKVFLLRLNNHHKRLLCSAHA